MEYDVIILAAGKGERTELGYNKMLYTLNDKRILDYACLPFLEDEECMQVIIVSNDVHQESFNHYKILVVAGGESRQESAYKGGQYALSPYVLVHDGARPNLSKKIIQRVKLALKEQEDCVVPIIQEDLQDGSYRMADKTIQTPQGFLLLSFLKAHEAARDDLQKPRFKDDASLVHHYLFIPSYYVEGDRSNFKITTATDLKRFVDSKNSAH